MKIFKPFFGVILEFENIKSFLLFTLGRICGVIVFFLMIDAFDYYLYLEGYRNEFTSVFYLFILLFQLFI